MEVVRPASEAAIHIPHHVTERDGGQGSPRQFRQPRFDFLQRFVSRSAIRVGAIDLLHIALSERIHHLARRAAALSR